MAKIKFNGEQVLVLADYSGKWYPLWNENDLSEDMRKSMSLNIEYEIEKDASFTNCGSGFKYPGSTGYTPCSGLWPNIDCDHCGGYGVGASLEPVKPKPEPKPQTKEDLEREQFCKEVLGWIAGPPGKAG